MPYNTSPIVLEGIENDRRRIRELTETVAFLERLAGDMASCLADDGDPVRLRPETKDWMEQNGYFDP